MNKSLRFGLIAGLIYFLGFSFGWAQIDVVKDMADPNTKLFSDGKTTVEAYVNSTISSKTNCCGDDIVYLKIILDGTGYASSVRALSGKNDCIKKSVEEIVSYVHWTVEATTKVPPIIIQIKVKAECGGDKTAASAFTKLGEPTGWAAAKQQFISSKGGGNTGNTGGNTENPGSGNPTSEPVVNNNPGGNTGGNTGGGQPNNGGNTGGNTNTQPRNDGGNSGGRRDPLTVVPNDTASAKAKMQAVELPEPAYKSMGERKPDSSHIKSYSNEKGPQYEPPKFVDGDAGMGVFIKSTYRKLQYCGLANVTAELTIETDGTVSAYRIFKANNDKVMAFTPYVLGSMRFQRLPRREYFILQYQSDVDCDGFPRNAVDKANFYFSAPDKAPRAPREDKSSTLPDNGGGDVLKEVKKQKDE